MRQDEGLPLPLSVPHAAYNPPHNPQPYQIKPHLPLYPSNAYVLASYSLGHPSSSAPWVTVVRRVGERAALGAFNTDD